jgi:pimeloyl-ACP methyl ester carboxylesterase
VSESLVFKRRGALSGRRGRSSCCCTATARTGRTSSGSPTRSRPTCPTRLRGPRRARALRQQSLRLPVVSDPLARRIERGGRAPRASSRPRRLDDFLDGCSTRRARPLAAWCFRLQSGHDDEPARGAPPAGAPVAGIVGFSGRLLAPERLAAEAVSKPPVLLVHGDADDIVPMASLTEAGDALTRAGFETYAPCHEGHRARDRARRAVGGARLHARQARNHGLNQSRGSANSTEFPAGSRT